MTINFPLTPDVGDQVIGPNNEVWLWDGVKWTAQGSGIGDYVPTTGGTMTGPLFLDGDPIEPLEAVPKEYVDRAVDDGVY